MSAWPNLNARYRWPPDDAGMHAWSAKPSDFSPFVYAWAGEKPSKNFQDQITQISRGFHGQNSFLLVNYISAVLINFLLFFYLLDGAAHCPRRRNQRCPSDIIDKKNRFWIEKTLAHTIASPWQYNDSVNFFQSMEKSPIQMNGSDKKEIPFSLSVHNGHPLTRTGRSSKSSIVPVV